MLQEFMHNLTGNLFKPLLLFFYMGFLIPLFKVPFEFPKPIYQGLTMYLLIAIGWHGGEELASLSAGGFQQAAGFMVIGFFTNLCIGLIAYQWLRRGTRLRQIDAAMVSGYYGSDSAGTFVTCLGVLTAANIAYAAYMPVLLAVMEIPGCLVALGLVSHLRKRGMDVLGNMPGEPGYIDPVIARNFNEELESDTVTVTTQLRRVGHETAVGSGSKGGTAVASRSTNRLGSGQGTRGYESTGSGGHSGHDEESHKSHQAVRRPASHHSSPQSGLLDKKTLHEVFLNPGLYLLFGGILIGFLGQLQGEATVKADNELFVNLFHGALCLFLLEMGITACTRLRDLKAAGWRFIVFAIVGPILFATIGMSMAHMYSMLLGVPFSLGTYALFAVLCAAASYIAVPAVQRLAVPEASPTLPLAASLGLTFTFNVTIGIPLYIQLAKSIIEHFPVT